MAAHGHTAAPLSARTAGCGTYLFTGPCMNGSTERCRMSSLHWGIWPVVLSKIPSSAPTSPLARIRLGSMISKTLKCYRGTHLVLWLDSPRQFAILPALARPNGCPRGPAHPTCCVTGVSSRNGENRTLAVNPVSLKSMDWPIDRQKKPSSALF
jgi:hypothetical protein